MVEFTPGAVKKPNVDCDITKNHFHIVITSQASFNIAQDIEQSHGVLLPKVKLLRHLYMVNGKSLYV